MNPSIAAALARCDPSARAALLATLEPEAARLVNAWFPEWAHGGQLAPAGDWRTWVLMAGRGFGKTWAGAEWVMGLVRPSTALGRREESSPADAGLPPLTPLAPCASRPLPRGERVRGGGVRLGSPRIE